MAGHECVGHVEIDKYANQSYRAIHKPKEREFFHEDITTITDESIRGLRGRSIDIIAGGFPCQAFSIAGKRAGFGDTRGTLFFDIARIAKEIKPKYLFLENVKGLLNHDRGDTFEVILRTLDEIGYDAEWQVLNSKHFGVPQNRERVFIIGHLRGSSTRKVFPITGERRPSVEGEQLSQKINQIGNLIDTDSFGGNPHRGRVYGTDGISPCLNAMGGGGLEPKVAIPIVFEQRTDEGTRHFNDGVCGTIRAKDSGGDKRVVIPVLTPDRAEKRQNGRRFKEDGDPMFTLTAQDRHGVAVGGIYTKASEKFQRGMLDSESRTIKASQHDAGVVLNSDNGFRIRKLTPKECWRLQGFPDWAFERAKAVGVSDSQLYKQAGNSVTVNVVYEIAKRLK
jgi:DNA (cytosine-5)-methyltransferase 1